MANLVSSPCATSILCGCLVVCFSATPHFNNRCLRVTCSTLRASTATSAAPSTLSGIFPTFQNARKYLLHPCALKYYSTQACAAFSILRGQERGNCVLWERGVISPGPPNSKIFIFFKTAPNLNAQKHLKAKVRVMLLFCCIEGVVAVNSCARITRRRTRNT
jgi:hypothetical protein